LASEAHLQVAHDAEEGLGDAEGGQEVDKYSHRLAHRARLDAVDLCGDQPRQGAIAVAEGRREAADEDADQDDGIGGWRDLQISQKGITTVATSSDFLKMRAQGYNLDKSSQRHVYMHGVMGARGEHSAEGADWWLDDGEMHICV